jgi:hypothetical protein
MLNYQDLTPAQQEAIDKWWSTRNEDDYECSDNYRYATVGNQEQEAQYKQAEIDGCCGFVDVVLDCSDGTQLMYGFNYGH